MNCMLIWSLTTEHLKKIKWILMAWMSVVVYWLHHWQALRCDQWQSCSISNMISGELFSILQADSFSWVTLYTAELPGLAGGTGSMGSCILKAAKPFLSNKIHLVISHETIRQNHSLDAHSLAVNHEGLDKKEFSLKFQSANPRLSSGNAL